MINSLPQNKQIILFDGVCNLCNTSVQYIIKHDKKDVFRFVSLQSTLGQEITKHIGINDRNIDSIVLYKPGIAYFYKANAVLQIAKNLGGVFTLASVFNILPKSFANFIYDFVAKNRYKWYGKAGTCMIPTPETQIKFL